LQTFAEFTAEAAEENDGMPAVALLSEAKPSRTTAAVVPKGNFSESHMVIM
jgi:hypothetical protein